MRNYVLGAVVGIASVGFGLFPAQAAPPAGPSTSAAGNSAAAAGPSESLSTKLNKSDGVITPKAGVDPGIHVPAPDPHPNSTLVVPPAATGGGTAK